jgi:hypothetical protein
VRPDIFSKILQDEYPALAELGAWQQSGLGASPHLLGMHLEEVGGFNEGEGLHGSFLVFLVWFRELRRIKPGRGAGTP